MYARSNLLAVLLLGFLAGCSPKRIPGTDIEDTEDSRAILQVMERYRSAVEAEDANTVASLVTPDFRDDGGTNETEDDFDAKNLAPRLAEQFQRLENIKLDIQVKKIAFDEDEEAAVVTYYWTARYELPSLSRKPYSDSELKQMTFKKLGDDWRIASGI